MLLGVIPPFLLQTEDNPDNPKGVPGSVFEDIKHAIVADRYEYFDDLFTNLCNTDVLAPERIGDTALRASFNVAAGASPYWEEKCSGELTAVGCRSRRLVSGCIETGLCVRAAWGGGAVRRARDAVAAALSACQPAV